MTDIEEMRKDLGRQYALKGEALHEGASEEFKKSFSRTMVAFGSNIMPSRFGSNVSFKEGWKCVCGFENKPNRTAKRGGIIVCWNCGTERAYGEDENVEG